MTQFKVKTALKVGVRRRGMPEVLTKLYELRNGMEIISSEIYKLRQEIAELKRFSAEGFGLSVPSSFATNYTSYDYPTTTNNGQNDYVDMTPRSSDYVEMTPRSQS